MKEASDWLARGRPMSGTVEIAFLRCARCGRGLYMTMLARDWGTQYCRGCDEKRDECYCPDTREVA